MTTNRCIRIRTVAVLGGGVIAGVIGASAFAASAQTTTGSGSTTASTTSTSSPTAGPRTHGTETPVTGAKAAALKAGALKQAPGATVNTITTEDASDSSGAAYEVHATTAAGARETLLFKSDLTYLSTEADGGHGGHGPGGNPDEKAVTGANATTLKAAALKHVPGATVDEVSTDSGDAAYEVHLTKADGSDVTVKFDKNLAFVAVETGRGK